MSSSTHGLSEAAVERLERVRGVDELSELGWEVEERDELLPRPFPQPNDCWIALAPLVGELQERGLGGIHARGGVNGLEGESQADRLEIEPGQDRHSSAAAARQGYIPLSRRSSRNLYGGSTGPLDDKPTAELAF